MTAGQYCFFERQNHTFSDHPVWSFGIPIETILGFLETLKLKTLYDGVGETML